MVEKGRWEKMWDRERSLIQQDRTKKNNRD